MPLNAGALIIGSLLWNERRQPWREARLDITSEATVIAPIRYGQLSGKQRGYTNTMFFSRLCEIGQAKVVPYSQSISSTADLFAEAEHLWKAEQSSAEVGRIASAWGCVALLCNPERDIRDDLMNAWATRVAREPDYGNVRQTEEEG